MRKIIHVLVFFGLISCSGKHCLDQSNNAYNDRDVKDEIFLAAKNNDQKLVNKLLGDGYNINIALRGAVTGKHDDLIDSLIASGADISEAIIEAGEIRYSIEKNKNISDHQVSFYTKTIDRLLSTKPSNRINYNKALSVAIILKDDRFLKEIISHDDSLLVQVVVSHVSENKKSAQLLLGQNKINFCKAVSFAIKHETLTKKEANNYKKLCFVRSENGRGAK